LEALDFILISADKKIVERCSTVCSEFAYKFKSWHNVDLLLEEPETPQGTLVVISTVGSVKTEAGGLVQVARQFFPNSFIICIVSSDLDNEHCAYVKKCGADVSLLENEIWETSKIEFISNQIIKASYLPIKSNEVSLGAIIDFDVFHLLPQRKKFLPCLFEGDIVNTEKFARLQLVGELYIKRGDSNKFNEYIKKTSVLNAEGLARRCRAQFLTLYSNYSDLIFNLTDQSEYSSFSKGQDILKKCKTISSELVVSLGSLGNAWDIINNSTIGEFSSVERAPAVGAYAVMYSLITDIGNVEDIMLAALIADIGLVFLNPMITKKIRANQISKLNKEEQAEYENHASRSLNIALERKIPIEEKLRSLILCTHECYNNTGFPNRPLPHKIPFGSQLIQLGQTIDQATLLKMGETRKDNDAIKRAIIQDAIITGKFHPDMLSKIKDL
jgi:response regulator RpfG family c-di-GMP phosphodiesterase